MMAKWQSFNYDHPTPDVTTDFSIVTPKETDIYEKPPSTRSFNAPVIYTSTTAGSFKSATVTVTADWTYLYDQGGLCFIIEFSDGSRKWIKTGIEMLDGVPLMSVVTKDRWADWSLRPLLDPQSKKIRVRLESTEDGNLWVFAVGEDGKKHPVREVSWWGEIAADTVVRVGPMAAKPSTEGGDLEVKFSNFVLETL